MEGGAVPSHASHMHLSTDRLVVSINRTMASLSIHHVPQDLVWSTRSSWPCYFMHIALTPKTWVLWAMIWCNHPDIVCVLRNPFANANGSIISDLCDEEWSLIGIWTKLTILVLFNKDFASYFILMGDSSWVFPFVVLFDQLLFAILDHFPVSFQLYV